MQDEKPNPNYESWPDFTQGEDVSQAVSRMAHSIEFMADPTLGNDAIQFMTMAAWGINNLATKETPYIVESQLDASKYFQVIRGSDRQYLSELGSPEAAGRTSDEIERKALEPLGWLMLNEDSPNYHREYPSAADIYDIAADAARGWFRAYNS